MILILKTIRKYLLASVLLGCFCVSFAYAQNNLSLSVSPTIFEMTAERGKTWQSNIRVINVNPYPLKVYATAVNFKPLDEKGVPEFIPSLADSEISTFADWITVPEGEIVVPAEQTLQIPIKITLPEDAAPGGHYAAVMVGTRPPEREKTLSEVETSQIVTSLLFLRVAGEVVEDGLIRSFRTTKNIIDKPEATLELRFQNMGNVYLQPQGQILIKNMWGQERGVIPVNQQTLFGFVPQDSIRNFSFTWTGEWSLADIGRYSAEASLAYGADGRKSSVATTSFWLIPWKIMLVVIVGIALFIWFVSWVISIYVKHMLKLAGVDPNVQYGSSYKASKTTKKISVVAPIEAGMLDLRTRFNENKDNVSHFKILYAFVKQYWLFFISVVLVIAVGYVLVWYIQNASKPQRAYEVSIESGGEQVKINSEEAAYDELKDFTEPRTVDAPIESGDKPALLIVNRSGVNGAAARAGAELEAAGYSVAGLETDLYRVESQTVIVYDPIFSEDALALSALLNNALLSAYAETVEDSNSIIVYVGTDNVD